MVADIINLPKHSEEKIWEPLVLLEVLKELFLAMKKYEIIKERNTKDLTFIVYDSPEMANMVERLASILRKKINQ